MGRGKLNNSVPDSSTLSRGRVYDILIMSWSEIVAEQRDPAAINEQVVIKSVKNKRKTPIYFLHTFQVNQVQNYSTFPGDNFSTSREILSCCANGKLR